MIFNKELLKLETGTAIFERGEEYFNENPNQRITFLLFSDKMLIKSKIKEYETSFKFSLSNFSLTDIRCSCPYHAKNSNFCKHIISLILSTELKIENRIKENIKEIDIEKRKELFKSALIDLNTFDNTLEKTKPSSVTKLTEQIKEILEKNPKLNEVFVEGEISTYSPNRSGHIYFSIKDENASLQCVMFKWSAQNLTFNPKTGDRVMLKGKITVYEPKGSYQLSVHEMKKAGEGDLFAKFLELKDKLAKQGIFDENIKKTLPRYPAKIGIITSPTGAVIKDIVNTIRRRYPCIKLIIYPSTMQGSLSEESVIDGLDFFDNKTDIDLIIIARGGGSLEDLWCFNSEKLAIKIYKCQKPIISAIGHETDFTICDFASDIRAPTPTAAAELSTPKLDEILSMLRDNKSRLLSSLKTNIRHKKEKLARLESEISSIFDTSILSKKMIISNYLEKLELLSIKKTLHRGFSLTLLNDKSLRNTKELKKGDKIKTIYSSGESISIIEEIKKK